MAFSESSTQRKRSVERKPSIERKPSMDRKLSADDVAKPTPAVGLDVDFAKSLRDFFREAREIQNGMHEMREYGLYKDFFCNCVQCSRA